MIRIFLKFCFDNSLKTDSFGRSFTSDMVYQTKTVPNAKENEYLLRNYHFKKLSSRMKTDNNNLNSCEEVRTIPDPDDPLKDILIIFSAVNTVCYGS